MNRTSLIILLSIVTFVTATVRWIDRTGQVSFCAFRRYPTGTVRSAVSGAFVKAPLGQRILPTRAGAAGRLALTTECETKPDSTSAKEQL